MLLTPSAKFSINRRCPGGTRRRWTERFSQPLVSPSPWWGRGGSEPPPSPGGGRPRRAESGPSQLSLRGPRLLSTPSLTRTSGPPPPPPRLRLRPLKSQHRRATWARPARQLRARRRVAALRGRSGELSGVCWSPRCAAGEGMSADFLCLPSGGGGGSGDGRRRRAEATVQGSAGGQQGRRCACP